MMVYETETTALKITPLDMVPQNLPNHTHQSSWMLSKGLFFFSDYLLKRQGCDDLIYMCA